MAVYKKPRISWSPAIRAAIIERRAEGVSLSAIASAMGITRARINQVMKRNLSSTRLDDEVISAIRNAGRHGDQ